MSHARAVKSVLAQLSPRGEVGRVDLEDCLLENMTGASIIYVRPDVCGSLDGCLVGIIGYAGNSAAGKATGEACKDVRCLRWLSAGNMRRSHLDPLHTAQACRQPCFSYGRGQTWGTTSGRAWQCHN
jgi:hypothetical protein